MPSDVPSTLQDGGEKSFSKNVYKEMQKNARGLGRDIFPTSTDTRSVPFPKVARVLIFSLSSF